jgi:hypothetical protein
MTVAALNRADQCPTAIEGMDQQLSPMSKISNNEVNRISASIPRLLQRKANETDARAGG